MKKISYFITLIVAFLSFSLHTFASSIIVVNGYSVRFRSEPNTNSSTIIYQEFNPGVELTYLETAFSGSGCSGPWYKAKYQDTTGYICSDYAILKEEEINSDDYTEYRDYLKALGFPDTYIPYLVNLHKDHPNWQFKVMNVDLDFDKMVSIEYDGYSQGWSLIEDYGSYYDGYKSTDSWAYNYLTNVFRNNYEGGGSRWYAANKQVISYYLDPRNFLNNSQIFMFENLSYNEKYHTKSGIEAMLKNTFMDNKLADAENEKTYADAFIDASNKYNVSPYVLVSRVIQEVGAEGSTIVSGTVSGYVGYYNFYNIKAYGNTAEETINNGLAYAKSVGWDTPYKAIVGGASFLSEDYIAQGQDTLYLQKWDLFGPKYGAHQYMQNIQAPASESIKTYNGYKNINLLDSSFVFTIPVFKNIPSSTSLPNKGNPNNYLSSLSVNGSYLFETATHDTEFNLNLDSSSGSIDIAASKVSSKSTISGTGSIALSGISQTISVVVTAENGSIRTYNINITRNEDVSLDISEILRVLDIKNDGSYIYGYSLGTDINTIVKAIQDKEPKATVSTFNKDGKEKSSGIIASGDKINIKTDREEKNYTIVIYGDASSDGKISSADYIAVKNHIMNVKSLSDLEKIYADANKDGKVNSADYITIKNHIMDVKKIEQ